MKKILFLTSVILCAIALALVIPNNVLAAPGTGAQLIVSEACIYDETSGTTGIVSGATYDLTTNTLTLNNYTGTHIEVNGMGSDFKIEVLGTNTLNSITINSMSFQDSVEFIGKGNLNINIEQGFTRMAGIHSMGDIIINDVNIVIVSNDNTAQHIEGIRADNSLKINSGTIKISGDINIGMISGGQEVIINGGTITISAKELGIGSPTGITINGGLLTLTSDEIALHSTYVINIKGGEIVLSGKKVAVLQETHDGTEPSIVLADNMEIVEDEVSLKSGTYDDGYMDYKFQTFGKGTITFNPQTREYENAAKKLTIKEKDLSNEIPPEQDTDLDQNDEDLIDESNQNTDKKDETPKTGTSLYSVNTITVVAIILLGAIAILKENK